MTRLALKMIFGERMKFYGLVAGLTFAVLLIVLLTSIFCGVLQSFFNVAYASGAPIWVMDATTESFDRPTGMAERSLAALRATPHIEWAEPYYMAKGIIKLEDGSRQSVQLVGISSETFAGLPPKIIAGSIDELQYPESVAIDKNQLDLIPGIGLGSTFELNDRSFKIAAILDMKPNSFSLPVCYIPSSSFRSCFPGARDLLSYVLVKSSKEVSDEELCEIINERHADLKAYTQSDFAIQTQKWYLENTNMPYMFGVIVLIGVGFGVLLTAQQFYTYVLENINSIAVLKALGFSNRRICYMMMVQILAVGFAAYGLAFGVIAGLGIYFSSMPRMFYYTPYQLMILAGVLVAAVCLISSFTGILKMRSIEPAAVFRM